MFKPLIIFISILAGAFTAHAQPSINDMQGCQAVINFVEQKLASPPEIYPKENVETVLVGLKAYDNYIQEEIVSPGLLNFNGGDQAKAEAMQEQVDTYKQSLVDNFNTRYPQNRIFTDHAMAINNCTNLAVPSGAGLEQLKKALETMVSLAQLG